MNLFQKRKEKEKKTFYAKMKILKHVRGKKNIIGNSSLAKTGTIWKNSHLNTFQWNESTKTMTGHGKQVTHWPKTNSNDHTHTNTNNLFYAFDLCISFFIAFESYSYIKFSYYERRYIYQMHEIHSPHLRTIKHNCIIARKVNLNYTKW